QLDVVLLVATWIGMPFEQHDRTLHPAHQLANASQPLRRTRLDHRLRRAEIHLQVQGLLERASMREALRLEPRRDLRDLALVTRKQALELVGLGASLCILLLGFDATRSLRPESVAEEAAEGRADHETDRASRRRADHGTAAETDRFMFRRAAVLGRPTRRRGRARHGENQKWLVVHLS